MGHNDLCRKRYILWAVRLHSEDCLHGLMHLFLILSFWKQCSKQRLPKESTKCPVTLHQQNGGTKKYPLFQPRKPVIKKLQEHLRGVHTNCFLQRSTWTVQAMEGKRSHASRLHRCLKTILRSQNSTGVFCGACVPWV